MVDDETLFKSMQVAAESGAVVMVHAENGDAIDVLVKEALAAGNTAPKYHALTRPPELEGEATNRAIQLAHVAGSPLYVVHVSCTDSIEPIERAREAGWDVWGETCSQYLMIDYSYIDQPGFEGAKYVYTPPPREKHHLEALLGGAAHGHALGRLDRPRAVQLPRARRTWARTTSPRSRTGRPGSRSASRSCMTSASRAGRFDLNRMVQLWATNPAKLFGLYPRKGTIAVGSDADIVIFDPEKKDDDVGRDPPLDLRLQPVRGHRGDRRSRRR